MKKITKFLVICSILIIHIIFILLIYLKNNNISDVSNEIVLSTNAGVPYSWNCAINDTTVAGVSNEYSKDLSAKNVTGGKVEIHYVIKANQSGSTQMVCEYRNFVDNTLAERKIYNIDVDENLNVNLEEK